VSSELLTICDRGLLSGLLERLVGHGKAGGKGTAEASVMISGRAVTSPCIFGNHVIGRHSVTLTPLEIRNSAL
jgi:hypothetical protein